MSDEQIEIVKLQLEAQMRREQMRSDLFKWFVALVWPVFLNLATAYVDHLNAIEVAGKADKAAQTSVAIAAKVDEIAPATLSTNAITAQWRAEHTGDPVDALKAAKAEQRLSAALEKMP